MNSARNLSDEELLLRLGTINSNETRIVATVLMYLIEVDNRKLYALHGYPSLFLYCVSVLNYCDGTAGRRIAAARCIAKFPKLLKLFVEQRLTLTTIVLISKILTEENQAQVVQAVSKKRKSEVEAYVASYLPEKSIREGIKPLPSQIENNTPRRGLLLTTADNEAPRISPVIFTNNNEIKSPAPKVDNEPLPASPPLSLGSTTQETVRNPGPIREEPKESSEINYEIKLKAPDSVIKKLRRVQQLRGRNESLGELLEVLLDGYLEKNSPEARLSRRTEREARKLNTVNKTVSNAHAKERALPTPTKQSRYIPQIVREQLHDDFKSQCAYVAPDGTRCSCREKLQVDHVYPFGLGGTNNKDNLRLLCPTHNKYLATQFYGTAKMSSYGWGNSSSQEMLPIGAET